MDAALALELRRLAAEIAALHESHDALARALLGRSDRRSGAVLVPLLGALFDGQAFTPADIAARALNDRTAEGQALRELVAEHSTDSGGLRTLGRLLSRLDGVEFDGARLLPAGRGQAGKRWRVSFSGEKL